MTDRDDPSNGYERIAGDYIAARSTVGRGLVRAWARSLPAPATLLDLGAGHGEPIISVLVEAGHRVRAIEAAPTLVAEFKQRFPDVEIACESVEDSDFFGRTYHAVTAIGLIFLLSEAAQLALIARVARALKPGGRFLFSAPLETGDWDDVLTRRRSQSLGQSAYRTALVEAGFKGIESHQDEGGSHYYDAVKASD